MSGYRKRVIEREPGRFEFEIANGGDPAIRQDYHPDRSGFVPMDEPTADAMADVVMARLVAQDAA